MTVGAKIGLGYCLALVILLIIGAVTYHNLRGLIESNRWVEHSHDVKSTLAGMSYLLAGSEAAARGYMLTGKERFLDGYKASSKEVEASLAKLKDLTRDNPKQQRRLEALGPVIHEKYSSMDKSLALRREGRPIEEVGKVVAESGSETMAAIKSYMADISREEDTLLNLRDDETLSRMETTKYTIIGGTLLALLIVSVCSILITRSITNPVREVVNQLSAASAEILAGTTQQSSGAQEQAAAVAQTVTTVDEVTQTSEHSAQGTRSLGETIQHSLEAGKTGRKVVNDSIRATEVVQEKISSTAATILALSNQAQAISEIITTVSDIAEQTNLLSLNAAIEASRAGEHGKGFSVVAVEIKALAEQSKKATVQIRQILGDIQRYTNNVVLSTEEVTKGVTDATKATGQAGETIKALTDTLAEAARVGTQIVASAGQQATGMSQIHQAMKGLDQITRQNIAAVRQAEQAARNLNSLGHKLSEMIGR